ncbi:MAG: ECF-type sigma factor [Planctomycetota bacterium]
MDREPGDVTRLLRAARAGDQRAADDVLPLVYGELRGRAAAYLRRERADHDLSPTGLVHEAYLKLVDQTRVEWKDRAHFFAIAATLMRRILVQEARDRNREKRGGGRTRVPLEDALAIEARPTPELLALDEALESLREHHELLAQIVDMRFFGGMTVTEVAEVLEIGERTVKRYWKAAQLFLLHKLGSI